MPCFRPFFFDPAQKRPPQHDIIAHLLTECLRQGASDINIEPLEGGVMDIFFRIGGTLHKAVRISNAYQAKTLRDAVRSQSQNLHPGEYDVIEGSITLRQPRGEITFQTYDIPQSTENCLLIRPCLPPRDERPSAISSKTLTGRTRNIDKKIFIWQMGKVGSLSVFSSLFPYSKPSPWVVPEIKRDTHWPKHNNIIQTHSIKLLYDFLHYSDEEFVIISLVRDLLARNISSIFQSMNFKEEWRNHFYIADKMDFQQMSLEQQEQEITRQLYKLNTSTLTTGWYDNLLRSHFYYPDIGKYFIDIYGKPFDQEKGLQIYESKSPRVQMIILRLEDLNARGKELGDFLGIENFRPVWGNAPTGKWYESIYKRFKARYRPTAQEVEAIYGSKFMRYFYSPTQINALIAKWNKQ